MKLFLTIKDRVAKDFFKSIFTNKLVAKKNASNSSKSKVSENKQNSKRNKKSRYRKHTKEAAITYHKCELLEHYHLHYFYLFSQKTPKDFKSRDKLKKAAEKALKKNINLTKEIK